MRRRLIIVLAVLATGLLAVTSASARATTEKIPFDIVLAPEEACGEAIHLSGTSSPSSAPLKRRAATSPSDSTSIPRGSSAWA